MEKRKENMEKLDAQLKEWGEQISLLRSKADKVKVEAKTEYHKGIDELQQKWEIAKVKLHELRTSSDEAWEDIKAGVEKAWAELKTAFEHAAAKFK